MRVCYESAADLLLTTPTHHIQPPKARLLLLRRQLHRAARCLLDARLHAGEWTFERCCAFLRDQGICATDEEAAGEVLRYAQKPGYAMAPFLGHAALVALRRGKEESEGPEGFNLAAFHRALLKHGAIPPPCVAYLNAEEAQAVEREQEGREGAIWI